MKIKIQDVTRLNEQRNSGKQSMYDELKSLQDEYDKQYPTVSMPETLGLQKLDIVTKTDEDLTKQAEEELRPEVEEKISEKKSSTDTDIAKVEQEKQANEKFSDEQIEEISREAEATKLDARNDVIDNGLANSSIAGSIAEGIEDNKNIDVQSEIDKLTIKQETLDAEIQTYERELDEALDNYEIKYAQDVQNRIDKLKAQLKDTNDKIIKYNNEIDAKEAAYQEERAKFQAQQDALRAEQEAYEEKYGYSGYKKENYEKRYEVALKYYDSLPKDTAISELNDDAELKQYLGLYYERLRYYLMMKK